MSTEEGRSWRHCIITYTFEVDGKEYTGPTREGVQVAGTCDCCDKAKIVVNYSSTNPEINNPSTLLLVGGKNARTFIGLLVSAAGIVLLTVAVIKKLTPKRPQWEDEERRLDDRPYRNRWDEE